MSQNWEDKFRTWAQSPSESETKRAENAEQMVRNAIRASSKLAARNIKVFAQGSYRNRTNIRQESDVDIGVLCDDTFFYELPSGTTRESHGITQATYFYTQFKNEVGEALIDYFGVGAVTRDAMKEERLDQDSPDCMARIERGHRILENHLHAAP